MSRKFFGTDGIRGRTNAWPMTAELAMKIGMAAGAHFQRGTHRHRVVIGKDTRLSGYLVENALVAGFTSVGMTWCSSVRFLHLLSPCWRKACGQIWVSLFQPGII